MEKINLYILDTRRLTLSGLLAFSHLNEEELHSLEKYKVIEVKKEKVASLYFKNKYIGEVSINRYGKPISDKVHFNISHSKGVIVLAISETREIGVDVEVIRRKDDELARFISNDEEYEFIKNEFDFFSIWTNKESLVKCIGTGFRDRVNSIPALPLNGKKEFNGQTYYSKITRNNDYIISLTLKGEEDFDFCLKVEDLHYE